MSDPVINLQQLGLAGAFAQVQVMSSYERFIVLLFKSCIVAASPVFRKC